MPVQDIGDPRLQALFGASDPRDAGIKPVVRLPQKGLPPAALAIAALAFALILFVVLNARRTSQTEPTAQTSSGGPVSWDAPPPLYIPPVEAPSAPPLVSLQPAPAPQVATAAVTAQRPAPPPMVYAPQPAPQIAPPFAPPAPRVSAGAPLVIDTGSAAGADAGSASNSGPLGIPNQSAGRQRASAFANRSTTVPQGSIVPAVLETGFDSSKPGFARAIVSRDVRGFDGKNILIPRGSRLIGEYRSDVAIGQKRAIINWTRLIRPDGMTIAMDSPAVDTLGRGGVPASVNTHFFQQLTGALLQSSFSIGSSLAGRAITGPVVVLPGGVNSASPQFASKDITPTLTVAPGKSISVFVAHDLDFSSAEGVR